MTSVCAPTCITTTDGGDLFYGDDHLAPLSDDALVWCFQFLGAEEIIELAHGVRNRRFYQVASCDLLWDLLFQRDAPILPCHHFLFAVMQDVVEEKRRRRRGLGLPSSCVAIQSAGAAAPAESTCTWIQVRKELLLQFNQYAPSGLGSKFAPKQSGEACRYPLTAAPDSRTVSPFRSLTTVSDLSEDLEVDMDDLLGELNWMEIYFLFQSARHAHVRTQVDTKVSHARQALSITGWRESMKSLSSVTNVMIAMFVGEDTSTVPVAPKGRRRGRGRQRRSRSPPRADTGPQEQQQQQDQSPSAVLERQEEEKRKSFRPSPFKTHAMYSALWKKLMILRFYDRWSVKTVLSFGVTVPSAYISFVMNLQNVFVHLVTKRVGTFEERRQRYFKWIDSLSTVFASRRAASEQLRKALEHKNFVTLGANRQTPMTEATLRYKAVLVPLILLRAARVRLFENRDLRTAMHEAPFGTFFFVDSFMELAQTALLSFVQLRFLVQPMKTYGVIVGRYVLPYGSYLFVAVFGLATAASIRQTWKRVTWSTKKRNREVAEQIGVSIAVIVGVLALRRVPFRRPLFALARRWLDTCLVAAFGHTSKRLGVSFSEEQRGDETALIYYLLSTLGCGVFRFAVQIICSSQGWYSFPPRITKEDVKEALETVKTRSSKDSLSVELNRRARLPERRKSFEKNEGKASALCFLEEVLTSSLSVAVLVKSGSTASAIRFRLLTAALLNTVEWALGRTLSPSSSPGDDE